MHDVAQCDGRIPCWGSAGVRALVVVSFRCGHLSMAVLTRGDVCKSNV